MASVERFETELNGGKLEFELGRLAGQADGACTVKYGGTMVLATAVKSETIREGIDFFPLMVDYEERLYAAGKIKGSRFIKREGRPSDDAILTSRLVDRSIRPLFDDSLRNDIQVVITVLSVDQENDPDVLSLIAASCALSISSIPWHGPIAGVRVGQINGEWVLNPTYTAREKSVLDLVVAADEEKILMIEAGGQQVSEQVVLDAIEFGHKHIKPLVRTIREIQEKVGKAKEMIEIGELDDDEKAKRASVEKKVKDFCASRIQQLFSIMVKKEQKQALLKLTDELEEVLKADNEVSKELRAHGVSLVSGLYEDEARRLVLEAEKRVDGRALDEIRPLASEVAVLPRTHGSGLFNRGETQVLSVVTLGSPGDEQLLDTMEETGKKRFMHHYNFPGFSTGEAKPIRSPGRREIGHGALVEKAIEAVMPSREEFPYTVRVVSEVLSSNGSSSQASCCGSTLALMDAGVPIKAPVAGIAIGLITAENDLGTFKILTDIQGVEDHNGDMDFKVAGTRTGITAIQMDTKLHGITLEITKEAFSAAQKARMQILDVIEKTIPAPRAELSPYAPRISMLRIDPEKIRDVIGRGGETINKIIDECGGADVTKIDIEQDGLVMITSHNAEMGDKAKKWIENLTHEIKEGEEYEGTVLKIQTDRNTGSEIGAIVELVPGQDGMVHISQFSYERIDRVSDFVKPGDKLKVKVVGVDKERGRIELSHKILKEPPAGVERVERPVRSGSRSSRGGFNRPPRRFHHDR
ncbi:MAG: polyribonucleotide nucleotidyltransferase [Patescibacteria group bacterium]|nr:polyribonucleotide nucleotidyltransferase [Patescibacteria group bacterium]MDD5715586.1 polyribonucleotide nucleotidyltransferase [Patescibacteria group bacterium]